MSEEKKIVSMITNVNKIQLQQMLAFIKYIEDFNSLVKNLGWSDNVFPSVLSSHTKNFVFATDKYSCIDGEYPIEIFAIPEFDWNNNVAWVRLWHEGRKRASAKIYNVYDLRDRYLKMRENANKLHFSGRR